jgi:DNA-directed RNA polymerase alpha subunit
MANTLEESMELDRSISDIGLRSQTVSTLENADIRTVKDLTRRTERELLAIGLATTELSEMIAVLKYNRLSLGMEA